jgi:phosphopantothenoylcysteine synthetase/decarboxylase
VGRGVGWSKGAEGERGLEFGGERWMEIEYQEKIIGKMENERKEKYIGRRVDILGKIKDLERDLERQMEFDDMLLAERSSYKSSATKLGNRIDLDYVDEVIKSKSLDKLEKKKWDLITAKNELEQADQMQKKRFDVWSIEKRGSPDGQNQVY